MVINLPAFHSIIHSIRKFNSCKHNKDMLLKSTPRLNIEKNGFSPYILSSKPHMLDTIWQTLKLLSNQGHETTLMDKSIQLQLQLTLNSRLIMYIRQPKLTLKLIKTLLFGKTQLNQYLSNPEIFKYLSQLTLI